MLTYLRRFSMLSPLYMAEISPPEVRGSLMALEQLAIVLGVVFGFWTGFFTRDRMYSDHCYHHMHCHFDCISSWVIIMENAPCNPDPASAYSSCWFPRASALSTPSDISG